MEGSNCKVQREQGGDVLTVASGGSIDIRTGGKVLANGTQAATIAALTVSVGTGDDTIADVGGAFNQTTLNNNFRDLADKYNLLLAACKGAGIVAAS